MNDVIIYNHLLINEIKHQKLNDYFDILIHIKSAFDRTNIYLILNQLKNIIERIWILILRKYKNIFYFIQDEGILSDYFQLKIGIAQGASDSNRCSTPT